MRNGLILEGGAMRGMFTAGVLDVMMESNIEFDGVVGVSAGAVFGCNCKSRQIGRAIRYNMRFCADERYCSFKSLRKSGDLFNADFCYREIPFELDVFDVETYNKNPLEFYAVCTDVETGRSVYQKCDDAVESLDWLRASASMPLASKIVEIGDKKLLDGGITDSVPLKFFESIGYERNIIVLTQPKGYIKKKNSLLPVLKLKYRKFPALYKAIKNRHNMYNSTTEYIEKEEKNGNILVIRPPEKLPVGRIEKNPEKLKVTYEIGRKEASKRLDEIKDFLKL